MKTNTKDINKLSILSPDDINVLGEDEAEIEIQLPSEIEEGVEDLPAPAFKDKNTGYTKLKVSTCIMMLLYDAGDDGMSATDLATALEKAKYNVQSGLSTYRDMLKRNGAINTQRMNGTSYWIITPEGKKWVEGNNSQNMDLTLYDADLLFSPGAKSWEIVNGDDDLSLHDERYNISSAKVGLAKKAIQNTIGAEKLLNGICKKVGVTQLRKILSEIGQDYNLAGLFKQLALDESMQEEPEENLNEGNRGQYAKMMWDKGTEYHQKHQNTRDNITKLHAIADTSENPSVAQAAQRKADNALKDAELYSRKQTAYDTEAKKYMTDNEYQKNVDYNLDTRKWHNDDATDIERAKAYKDKFYSHDEDKLAKRKPGSFLMDSLNEEDLDAVHDWNIPSDKVEDAKNEIEDAIGADTFLEDICKALGNDRLKSILSYIGKNHDLDDLFTNLNAEEPMVDISEVDDDFTGMM